MSDFIGKRIDESLSVCRAYLCLLSSTMGSAPAAFDVSALVKNILAVQAKVYQDKCSDAFNSSSRKAGREWLEEKLQGIGFSGKFNGKITGFDDLIYFISEHTITNMLKATFLAAANQRNEREFFSFSKDFANAPLIAEPRITVEMAEDKNGNVIATFTDNGLGIPKENLAKLFTPEKINSVFPYMVSSNGSSLKLFPYIMDLTGVRYHIESEVGQGTKVTLTIPKEAKFIA